jgi:hypothetical protein
MPARLAAGTEPGTFPSALHLPAVASTMLASGLHMAAVQLTANCT